MNDQELEQLHVLLQKCTPGALPPQIFADICRLVMSFAVEFVPLRLNNGRLEVLLISRDSDDPFWPNALHTPGTVLRPGDTSLEDAFKRLLIEELVVKGGYTLTDNGMHFIEGERGQSVLLEYVLECEIVPKNGIYYGCDNLPENFIPEQKPLVERAITRYKQLHSL